MVLLNSHFFLALSFISLLASAHPTPDGDAEPHHRITTYVVPGNNTFPEGIARQLGSPYFYVGGVLSGDIFRGNVNEKNLVPFLTGATYGITNAVGMKIDCKNRLYIAGGGSGTVFVFDVDERKLLHRFSNGFTGLNVTLLNDLAIDDAGNVYITDSVQSTLFRIRASDLGGPQVDLPLEPWLDLTGTISDGGNGIVVTPDQDYLLVADSNAGEIWRVVIATKGINKIDFGGGAIGEPDGLLFRDDFLYAVNSLQEIGQFVQVIQITAPYNSGTLVRRITSPLFERPSTAAFDGKDLLVSNFQFNSTRPPVLPFTVVRVPYEY